MKKLSSREIFSIPNILSYFRILLIPVFCLMYLKAEDTADYLCSGAVVLISSITDMLDGRIARKFNMITDLGKVLDPVADKLSHAALAVCLAIRHPIMWALIALMVVKEGFMGIMGIYFLRRGRMLNGAKWYGKVCTAALFVGLLVLFLFPNIPELWVNVIIVSLMVIMLAALIMYIPEFKKMYRGEAGLEVGKPF